MRVRREKSLRSLREKKSIFEPEKIKSKYAEKKNDEKVTAENQQKRDSGTWEKREKTVRKYGMEKGTVLEKKRKFVSGNERETDRHFEKEEATQPKKRNFEKYDAQKNDTDPGFESIPKGQTSFYNECGVSQGGFKRLRRLFNQ